MPPYTNLSLFLIISSKNYISHPPKITKSVATVVFVRKVPQGSSFKKDSQFNSNFSIGIWCYGCAAAQTFLSYLSNCHYSQRSQFLLFHTRKKKIIIIIILNLFFCGEYVNLYYIHIYADFTFLVSACILNDDCISKKSKNFHQVRQAHIKSFELQ